MYFSINYTAIAQTYNPSPQNWIVNAETANCENKINECYLVKQPGHKEFELFYEEIEGFNYEKGYEYAITVKQEIKQPPIAAGESVFKYVLVKINSKKAINIPTENVSSTSTSTNAKQKILEINFETVPCDNANKYCLLVKEKGKNEFEILYATIYGFNYQPGYSYTIAVKETTDGNYYLVNEINKKFIKNSDNVPIVNNNTAVVNNNSNNSSNKIIGTTSIQSNTALDGKWYLRKMKENEGQSIVTDDNVMQIVINTFNDRLEGKSACGNFAAVVKTDFITKFETTKTTTTNQTNCGNKKVDELFFELLQSANKFELKKGHLILSKDWSYVLDFVSDPNNTEDILSTYVPANIVNTSQTTTVAAKNPNAIVNSTTTKNEQTNNVVNDEVLSAKDKEIEELKKQLAAKKQAEEQAQQAEEIKKQAQIKAQKDAEIEALKKQLDAKKNAERQNTQIEEQKKQAQLQAQKDAEIDALKKQLEATENSNAKNTVSESKSIETKNTSTTKNETNNNTKEEDNAENHVKNAANYSITTFQINTTNNIPEPEFPLRPYYLDGNNLVKLERAEANFVAKAKGIYRGVDLQVQIMKEESPIQFLKNKLPRFFVVINDDDTDPFDVIDLCKADKIGKGRRNFTYAGKKYGGRVKDVTGKLASLDFKKIRNGLYEIIIDQELEQGEYAFLPLFKNDQGLSSTNSIKANCFGIVDPEK